jgi:hypothetical protein
MKMMMMTSTTMMRMTISVSSSLTPQPSFHIWGMVEIIPFLWMSRSVRPLTVGVVRMPSPLEV